MRLGGMKGNFTQTSTPGEFRGVCAYLLDATEVTSDANHVRPSSQIPEMLLLGIPDLMPDDAIGRFRLRDHAISNS